VARYRYLMYEGPSILKLNRNEIDIDKVDIGKENGKFLIYKMFNTVNFSPFACKFCKKCRY
jgi:hypothetical protein